jgi:murein L,D-transpeptidase YcbB/YkuD
MVSMNGQVVVRGLEALTVDDPKDEHAVKDDGGITTSNDHIRDGKGNAVKTSMLTRLLVTVVALAAVAAHLAWSNLKVDGVVVAMLVVALLPWLGSVFESLELPGGWKLQYREIQQQLEKSRAQSQQAIGAAASASRKADFALAASEPASGTGTAIEQFNQLVVNYDDIRATQQSSNTRTKALTQVVAQLVALASKMPDYPWQEALSSDDRGRRVAAYAWLYARPDADASRLLAQTLTTGHEDTDFGQYWDLQALQRCLQLADPHTAATLKPQLERFLPSLPPNNPRYHELADLLQQMP